MAILTTPITSNLSRPAVTFTGGRGATLVAGNTTSQDYLFISDGTTNVRMYRKNFATIANGNYSDFVATFTTDTNVFGHTTQKVGSTVYLILPAAAGIWIYTITDPETVTGTITTSSAFRLSSGGFDVFINGANSVSITGSGTTFTVTRFDIASAPGTVIGSNFSWSTTSYAGTSQSIRTYNIAFVSLSEIYIGAIQNGGFNKVSFYRLDASGSMGVAAYTERQSGSAQGVYLYYNAVNPNQSYLIVAATDTGTTRIYRVNFANGISGGNNTQNATIGGSANILYYNGTKSLIFGQSYIGYAGPSIQLIDIDNANSGTGLFATQRTALTGYNNNEIYYNGFALSGNGNTYFVSSDYRDGLTFFYPTIEARNLNQSLISTVNFPVQISKVSGGKLTVNSSVDWPTAALILRSGASLIHSGLSNLVLGWAFTATDEQVGVFNEDLAFSGSAALTGSYQASMASGTKLILGTRSAYNDSITMASGSTVVCNQSVDLRSLAMSATGVTIDNSSAGAITVQIASGVTVTTTSTGGGAITISQPVAAVVASNFADGVRAQISHRQTFTIASTAINTTTDVITLGNDSNGDAANFRTSAPNTLIRFSLSSGATVPASTPQIFDGGLYYWKTGGQLSITAGGAAINFSSQGSGNFVLIAETEISNTAVSGGSGLSVALTRSANAAIRVKAAHWSESAGTAKSSKFFDQVFAWSATSGITIPDTVNNTITASQDSIHEQIVALSEILLGGSIQNASGTFINSISPADSGQSVSGLSLALEGVGRIQMNANDADGILAWQDLYLWGCFVRATEAGIRLASANTFIASDIFNFVFENLEFDNTGSVPLAIVGGVGRSADGSSVIASGSGSIALNALSQGTGAISSSGGGGLDAAGVRSAIGIDGPNLDTKLANLQNQTARIE